MALAVINAERAAPSWCRARRFVHVLALAAATAFFAAEAGRRAVWNLSASVPRGLYWTRPQAPCALGSLVTFQPPGPVATVIRSRGYLPPGAGLLKRVVALPGDPVCVRQDGYYANGRRIGDVARADRAGRPLALYSFCGLVPEGSAFVATSAPLSYDSRYFGPVPVASLTVVVPLWTY
jgi:conjugative transfer signal peptidase TraF